MGESDYMTENYIKSLVLNLDNIKTAASNFVDSVQKDKNTGGHNIRSCRAEELTFDSFTGFIDWEYEYNGACHCHPEMHTHNETYRISDFVKWLSENNVEPEQFTEAQFAADWA